MIILIHVVNGEINFIIGSILNTAVRKFLFLVEKSNLLAES